MGQNATITSFEVAGLSSPIVPGTGPVQLVDPATGILTGTIEVNPDGSYVFTPAPGYSGPVPTVTATVTSTDGQSATVPLTLTVNSLLMDANESPTMVAGTGSLTLNALDNSVAPAGTTVSITNFTLPGSSVVYQAGPTPVTVVDPITKAVVGTVVMQPNGTTIFTPVAGYTGQAPAITYNVESSDGQTSPGVLSVTVLSSNPLTPAPYTDTPDAPTTPMGEPVSGNVLANAYLPPGTTAQVTAISIAGTNMLIPVTAAGTPIMLTDPATGQPVGTLTITPNGTYTFDPVPGYVGPVPAIDVYSKDTNGQTAVSSLTVDVVACGCTALLCAIYQTIHVLYRTGTISVPVCICICTAGCAAACGISLQERSARHMLAARCH